MGILATQEEKYQLHSHRTEEKIAKCQYMGKKVHLTSLTISSHKCYDAAEKKKKKSCTLHVCTKIPSQNADYTRQSMESVLGFSNFSAIQILLSDNVSKRKKQIKRQ